jgi:tRNA uridine 5-carboxymethylaminomethyl modification enzyme
MKYIAGKYDVAVIGAGHAGCEAALAAARMGKKTVIFSTSLEAVAMMACNPSIGGTSKGHIVREIDALGGEMGLVIDETLMQIKMLNTSKGPAVHSLRAQADKKWYQAVMKKRLEQEANITLKQGEIQEIDTKNGHVIGVQVVTGEYFECSAAIVAAGVYLKSKIIIGAFQKNSGPSGLFAANELSAWLENNGFPLRRFKTGTPARVDGKTLDYEKMAIQNGEDDVIAFSFMNEPIKKEQVPCWLTYTNEKTHEIIRNNIHRSPLYSGQIEGVGPRYCPSIEDKVMRFADKSRHQLFIEPEGYDTNEKYVQGMSSSLPIDVQIEMYRTVQGMEQVEFMRPAYAIEYDCIDATQLTGALAAKHLDGLFFAGQINGSSGYEEAAGQGLVAGINAVRFLNNEEPFIIERTEGYIGVLIDDLITKGTPEPYRMMTSRAEHRLILRQDNADERLTERGFKLGLVTKERYKNYLLRSEKVEKEIHRLKEMILAPSKDTNMFLAQINSAELITGIRLYDLLKRPEILYEDIEKINQVEEKLTKEEKKKVEVQIKYEGYIKKQQSQVERMVKMAKKTLPNDLDYSKIRGLRIEAAQKLNQMKPRSIGQAQNISGVSPADISVLMVYFTKTHSREEENRD